MHDSPMTGVTAARAGGEPRRAANLLGALSLAVADAMRRATEDAAGHARPGPRRSSRSTSSSTAAPWTTCGARWG